jgi:flagellar hook-associated protein 2
MASITSTGIGSGLDVNAIISQLMAVESQPLNLLQQQQSSLNSELSSIGKLTGFASAMRDAAQKIASVSLWKQTVATSGDSASVAVTTASGAATGNYAVSVQALAKSQTISSRAFGSATETVGEGTLTIELGTWTGEPAPTGFTAKTGSTPLTVTIGPDDTSLEAIRDKINGAAAGVTATIVTDASGARLALRSTATGAENAFRITASETNDDGVASTGLSAFAYDATVASQMTRNTTASNAQATINGITVTSASNELSGVADGLTLSLLKETSADVAVAVSTDDEGRKSAITSFVKAFNDLAGYIRDQTKYDAESKTGGALQGDRTALGLQSQMRAVLNNPSSASALYSRLSDIGITIQSDGTLATDSTKLDAALDNPDELRKLLSADGATSDADGFMQRFVELGNAVTGDDGSLDARTESLEAMIKRNETSQEQMENRLAKTEERLRAQYQALDTTMAKMSALSSYLSGQLAALTSTS